MAEGQAHHPCRCWTPRWALVGRAARLARTHTHSTRLCSAPVSRKGRIHRLQRGAIKVQDDIAHQRGSPVLLLRPAPAWRRAGKRRGAVRLVPGCTGTTIPSAGSIQRSRGCDVRPLGAGDFHRPIEPSHSRAQHRGLGAPGFACQPLNLCSVCFWELHVLKRSLHPGGGERACEAGTLGSGGHMHPLHAGRTLPPRPTPSQHSTHIGIVYSKQLRNGFKVRQLSMGGWSGWRGRGTARAHPTAPANAARRTAARRTPAAHGLPARPATPAHHAPARARATCLPKVFKLNGIWRSGRGGHAVQAQQKVHRQLQGGRDAGTRVSRSGRPQARTHMPTRAGRLGPACRTWRVSKGVCRHSVWFRTRPCSSTGHSPATANWALLACAGQETEPWVSPRRQRAGSACKAERARKHALNQRAAQLAGAGDSQLPSGTAFPRRQRAVGDPLPGLGVGGGTGGGGVGVTWRLRASGAPLPSIPTSLARASLVERQQGVAWLRRRFDHGCEARPQQQEQLQQVGGCRSR